MNQVFSADELADIVNRWCERHRVFPANGQAGERITVRNIRYYRTLGLLDPPDNGGGQGFNEKHRLQLVAIRLLQARGLPLNRIQELLFGRSLDDLGRIESEGLAELEQTPTNPFRPVANEGWNVTTLNDEFLLISRRGRSIPAGLRDQIRSLLAPGAEESINLNKIHESNR